MAKKTKKTETLETAEPIDGATLTPASDDQTPTDTIAAEETASDEGASGTVEDAPTTEGTVKPTAPLAGEAELAARKGTWKYDGAPSAVASERDVASAASPAETPAPETPEDPPQSDASVSETPDTIIAETGPDTDIEPAPSQEAADAPGSAREAATSETRKDPKPVHLAPPPQQIVERKGGFFPMLMGGIVAAAVGYGVADYTQPGGFFGPSAEEPDPFETETRAALSEATERLAALESAEVDFTPVTDGLDALSARIDALADNLSALEASQSESIAALSAAQSETDARLTELAQSAITESVSETVIATYEEAIAGYTAEIVALQDSVAAQRDEIETLVTEATTRESEALALAQTAQVQAAAAALMVQMETGEPYAEALDAYLAAGGDAVAPALSDLAADGLPSLEELQQGFPDAARAALAITRDPDADASDGAGGLGTFFARQLQVRSVAPREGDEPDAVLSRAEAAVRMGDLNTALGELEMLPEGARAALSDWEATAKMRRDALAAATALTSSAQDN